MKITRIVLIGTALFCIFAVCIPFVSAADSSQSWSSNPEHIAVMKASVAWVSEENLAKMSGAISYIGTISGSAGTADLTTVKQQFSATAASVQSMTTSDSITTAHIQMKGQVDAFRTATENDMKAYNGSASVLHTSVNASVAADQATIDSLKTAYWTARETSRLDEFTHNDAIRNEALANMTAKGIDVSPAQGIETQISGLQPSLKAALDARDETALAAVDTQLGTLGKQFWEAIGTKAWQSRETTRLAEFDKRTAALQNELTNLTARGVDVTSAQAILTQITAERDPLKTAFESKDQQAAKTIESQLKTLYDQFRKTIQGYHQSAVNTVRERAGNTTRNASAHQPPVRGPAKRILTTAGNISQNPVSGEP